MDPEIQREQLCSCLVNKKKKKKKKAWSFVPSFKKNLLSLFKQAREHNRSWARFPSLFLYFFSFSIFFRGERNWRDSNTGPHSCKASSAITVPRNVLRFSSPAPWIPERVWWARLPPACSSSAGGLSDDSAHCAPVCERQVQTSLVWPKSILWT